MDVVLYLKKLACATLLFRRLNLGYFNTTLSRIILAETRYLITHSVAALDIYVKKKLSPPGFTAKWGPPLKKLFTVKLIIPRGFTAKRG